MNIEFDQIYCMDAVEFLKEIPDDFCDMILTSPPYDSLRVYEGYSFNFESVAHESYRVLKNGGVMVWVVGDATIDGSETLTSFRQALYFKDQVGFSVETMIYHKNSSQPNANKVPRYMQVFEYMFVLIKGKKPKVFNPILRNTVLAGKPRKPSAKMQPNGNKRKFGKNAATHYGSEIIMDNIWKFNTGAASKSDLISFEHPAPFPEELAERHILTWTNPNELILDFFMGSGTTGKVAKVNNRKFIGCDISDKYCNLAKMRIEDRSQEYFAIKENKPYPLRLF